ncbi:MAG: YIP1 family protein [Candidatus Krumholzibacteria bacterium]|nr:YIP1 family protein [Candidatus Krumholzibacteria bacterium]MDH4335933.1 YIP1 family protein [Candidatus Krumholzibacteria bacterium]MDH5268491.1 YIP1 family protein [Candidatus Krumholzibacteria bacterium]MDH5627761.1 YIP1 family protein [Candidatus Krumholzibacteria bacterium]
MTFINRFVSMLTAPSRVFDDIRESRVGWKQPWLIISVMYMVLTFLSLPIQVALLELNPQDVSPEILDQQIRMVDSFGWVWVVLTPLGVLVMQLIVAGLTYILVTIMSQRATFKQYLSLNFFAGIPAMIGQLLSVVLIRTRGLERIMGPEDARMSFSLRALAPPDSAALKGLYGGVEFFTIWSLVLLAMGLSRVFGMSRAQAIGVVIPLWLIMVVMLILGEIFGGMGG